MSGHNKWANIRIRKTAQDAKRGKLFSRLIREITIAAREGGPEPENNPALKVAIERARDANMPKETIEKAIARASGELGGAQLERVSYEGYGPFGVAVVVETLTDNRNRTVAELRSTFMRYGGSLGETGCVSWMFKRKGLVVVDKNLSEDEILEIALEGGAEDVKVEDDGYYIYCPPSALSQVREALLSAGAKIQSSQITMIADTTVRIEDENDAGRLIRFLGALEELDDVQQIHANWEMSDKLLEKVAV